MKLRAFTIAAFLHGTTIALAFSLVPAQSLQTSPAKLGTVAVEHQAESLEPAQLPLSAVIHPDHLDDQPIEAAPAFVAEHAPEEPVKTEALPDPVDTRPIQDQPEPPRPRPTLELPRPAKGHQESPAQRAATPVENAPSSGESPDFTPGELLEWEPPDSLLYKFRGTIIVIIELDASGKARSVSMQTGTGDDDIDQDVRVALLKGKYSAARDGERAIATTLTRRFNIFTPK